MVARQIVSVLLLFCVCCFACKNMAVKLKQYLTHDDLILLFSLLPAGSAEYGVVYCVCVYIKLLP